MARQDVAGIQITVKVFKKLQLLWDGEDLPCSTLGGFTYWLEKEKKCWSSNVARPELFLKEAEQDCVRVDAWFALPERIFFILNLFKVCRGIILTRKGEIRAIKWDLWEATKSLQPYFIAGWWNQSAEPVGWKAKTANVGSRGGKEENNKTNQKQNMLMWPLCSDSVTVVG